MIYKKLLKITPIILTTLIIGCSDKNKTLESKQTGYDHLLTGITYSNKTNQYKVRTPNGMCEFTNFDYNKNNKIPEPNFIKRDYHPWYLYTDSITQDMPLISSQNQLIEYELNIKTKNNCVRILKTYLEMNQNYLHLDSHTQTKAVF